MNTLGKTIIVYSIYVIRIRFVYRQSDIFNSNNTFQARIWLFIRNYIKYHIISDIIYCWTRWKQGTEFSYIVLFPFFLQVLRYTQALRYNCADVSPLDLCFLRHLNSRSPPTARYSKLYYRWCTCVPAPIYTVHSTCTSYIGSEHSIYRKKQTPNNSHHELSFAAAPPYRHPILLYINRTHAAQVLAPPLIIFFFRHPNFGSIVTRHCSLVTYRSRTKQPSKGVPPDHRGVRGMYICIQYVYTSPGY